jgi:hypothetical protein
MQAFAGARRKVAQGTLISFSFYLLSCVDFDASCKLSGDLQSKRCDQPAKDETAAHFRTSFEPLLLLSACKWMQVASTSRASLVRLMLLAQLRPPPPLNQAADFTYHNGWPAVMFIYSPADSHSSPSCVGPQQLALSLSLSLVCVGQKSISRMAEHAEARLCASRQSAWTCPTWASQFVATPRHSN